MNEPLAYRNGAFWPASHVHLALNDTGFVFGATVTDFCRTFRHRLFRLQDHLTRFRQSCALAHVAQLRTDEELAAAAQELIRHNASLIQSENDLGLVMFATPGEIAHYAGRTGDSKEETPTLGMHTFPLPFQRYARLDQQGAHLVTPTTRQVPPECFSPRIKHRSRLHWWLAEQEAHAVDPTASALLLDAAGHVTETAVANLLIVWRGRVLTPPRERVLPGISLSVVEELCQGLGIDFQETDLELEDCLNAEEAFLSNTSYCLVPVSRINDTSIPWPGPIFEKLLTAWGQQVGVDIRGQILGDAHG